MQATSLYSVHYYALLSLLALNFLFCCTPPIPNDFGISFILYTKINLVFVHADPYCWQYHITRYWSWSCSNNSSCSSKFSTFAPNRFPCPSPHKTQNCHPFPPPTQHFTTLEHISSLTCVLTQLCYISVHYHLIPKFHLFVLFTPAPIHSTSPSPSPPHPPHTHPQS